MAHFRTYIAEFFFLQDDEIKGINDAVDKIKRDIDIIVWLEGSGFLYLWMANSLLSEVFNALRPYSLIRLIHKDEHDEGPWEEILWDDDTINEGG